MPPSPVHLAVILSRSARALAAAALLVLAPRVLGAAGGRSPAGEPRAATPEERRAEAAGYVFGRVEIAPGDIFDPERPGEDNPLRRPPLDRRPVPRSEPRREPRPPAAHLRQEQRRERRAGAPRAPVLLARRALGGGRLGLGQRLRRHPLPGGPTVGQLPRPPRLRPDLRRPLARPDGRRGAAPALR